MINIKLFFGIIKFIIIFINILFLLYSNDMKKLGIYLDNIKNIIIYNGKNYFIIIKQKYS